MKQQFQELSSGAHLDVLLPESQDLDRSALAEEGRDALSRVSVRSNVYFDEEAALLLIFTTSMAEDELRSLLPSLEITLAAHATDAVPQGSGNAASASGKYDLSTRSVPGPDAADIFTTSSNTIAIWKSTLHLTRPRVRLQRPAVYFTAHLSLSAQAVASSKQRAAGVLESFQPLPANILEPLKFDPALSQSNLYLSETRISTATTPIIRREEDVKPIRGASKRAFPIVPALFTRIKYSALPDGIIASLHLEASRVISGSLAVREVHLNIPHAKVDALNASTDLLRMAAGDETVLMYRLKRHPEVAGSDPSHMSVKIEIALVQDGVAGIRIPIAWQAQVDLSRTSPKATYKWSRPLSTGSQQAQRLSAQNTQMPSLPDLGSQGPAEDSGILFTFSTPPIVVAGQEFRLTIQCVNRTNQTRRFTALSIQPKQEPPEDIQGSTEPRPNNKAGRPTIAELLSPLPAYVPRMLDVHCKQPDVRIGLLAPQAIFETDMKFVATSTGPLDLGLIRILDLDTRRTVDVKELPDIVALDRPTMAESDNAEESGEKPKEMWPAGRSTLEVASHTDDKNDLSRLVDIRHPE